MSWSKVQAFLVGTIWRCKVSAFKRCSFIDAELWAVKVTADSRLLLSLCVLYVLLHVCSCQWLLFQHFRERSAAISRLVQSIAGYSNLTSSTESPDTHTQAGKHLCTHKHAKKDKCIKMWGKAVARICFETNMADNGPSRCIYRLVKHAYFQGLR